MRQFFCKFFSVVLILLLSSFSKAEDKQIAELFLQQKIEGTLVLSSLKSKQVFIHNDLRAKHRFIPASTFKIPNTLIALEEKAASGKTELFRWNGTDYGIPDWNRDQTLESAFKVSCVWCFQELARRVGPTKYQSYLRKIDYGKLGSSFETTMFWLDGSLTISALEQIKFLKKVYERLFPFSKASYDTLQEIMVVERNPSFTLRAKTGWATPSKKSIGWYVGYVETPDEVWFFALNLDVRTKDDLALRQQLVREALKIKKIIQ